MGSLDKPCEGVGCGDIDQDEHEHGADVAFCDLYCYLYDGCEQ